MECNVAAFLTAKVHGVQVESVRMILPQFHLVPKPCYRITVFTDDSIIQSGSILFSCVHCSARQSVSDSWLLLHPVFPFGLPALCWWGCDSQGPRLHHLSKWLPINTPLCLGSEFASAGLSKTSQTRGVWIQLLIQLLRWYEGRLACNCSASPRHSSTLLAPYLRESLSKGRWREEVPNLGFLEIARHRTSW